MFGLTDSVISLAYILNFLAVILSVGYGIVFWNKGGEISSQERAEEQLWAEEEKKLEKEFE